MLAGAVALFEPINILEDCPEPSPIFILLVEFALLDIKTVPFAVLLPVPIEIGAVLPDEPPIDIVFNPSLTSDPSSVQITVESSGKDGDFTYYIQSPNKNGCKIFFNPVQSASSTAASVIGTVTVHYFAMAG